MFLVLVEDVPRRFDGDRGASNRDNGLAEFHAYGSSVHKDGGATVHTRRCPNRVSGQYRSDLSCGASDFGVSGVHSVHSLDHEFAAIVAVYNGDVIEVEEWGKELLRCRDQDNLVKHLVVAKDRQVGEYRPVEVLG